MQPKTTQQTPSLEKSSHNISINTAYANFYKTPNHSYPPTSKLKSILLMLILLSITLNLNNCTPATNWQRQAQMLAAVRQTHTAIQFHQWHTAQQQLKLIRKLSPNYKKRPLYWSYLATIENALGDLQLARQAAKRAVQLAPQSLMANNNYAVLLCQGPRTMHKHHKPKTKLCKQNKPKIKRHNQVMTIPPQLSKTQAQTQAQPQAQSQAQPQAQPQAQTQAQPKNQQHAIAIFTMLLNSNTTNHAQRHLLHNNLNHCLGHPTSAHSNTS